MAKTTKIKNKRDETQNKGPEILSFRRALLGYLMNATSQSRDALTRSLLNPGKDINYECGYPDTILVDDYRDMWNREAIGRRVVSILPEECWTQLPEVYETETPEKTPMEKKWAELSKRVHVEHYLKRLDIMSGIGSYGIMILGLSDGRTMDQPVAGINPKTGEPMKTKKPPKMDLMYLRVFDEKYATISTKETDTKSPRYGFPLTYTVQFSETVNGTTYYKARTVHWTRVLHAADNRESSETVGVPRMYPVWNRLLDIRKILGGSGEMYWKGGFPGLSFEALPDTEAIDADALKTQIDKYFSGLQRYLAIQGVTTKSLAPQVVDPKGALEAHIQQICLQIGVPLRVFLGSEEGKLASTQDKRLWAERVMERRFGYVTPMIISPFLDMLIAYGIVPKPQEYFVDWPDRAAVSDRDMADVARIRAEAMKSYTTGECWRLMSFYDFLVREMKYTAEEAKQIANEANKTVADEEQKKIDEEERRMEMEVAKAKAMPKPQVASTPKK